NDFAHLWPRRISFRTGGLITGVIGILIQPWKLVADPSGYIYTWLIAYSALPRCTRRLWPRPRILPWWTRTEPMGMPPSARPASASAMAAAMNSSMLPPGFGGRCAPERPHQSEIAAERHAEADEPGV